MGSVAISMSSIALYVVTVLVWGSTWIGIEYQLGVVAPEVSVFYRYALASALLFTWCVGRGLRLHFSLRDHGRFVLLGIFLFGLNYVLTYRAQVHISSALTAIAFSTMLWMNMLNSRLFFGVRSSPLVILGSIFGIAGVVTLFVPQIDSASLSDSTLYGALLCISAAFIASLGNMVAQSANYAKLPIVQTNAWGMLYGAMLTGSAAAAQGMEFNFDFSTGYVASLLYLAVFGSIVAFGAYLTLLGRIGAHRAAYAVVMFPVVAVIISLFFEGLEVSWSLFAGVMLVLAGNVLILRVNERPTVDASDDAATGTVGDEVCAEASPTRT